MTESYCGLHEVVNPFDKKPLFWKAVLVEWEVKENFNMPHNLPKIFIYL